MEDPAKGRPSEGKTQWREEKNEQVKEDPEVPPLMGGGGGQTPFLWLRKGGEDVKAPHLKEAWRGLDHDVTLGERRR